MAQSENMKKTSTAVSTGPTMNDLLSKLAFDELRCAYRDATEEYRNDDSVADWAEIDTDLHEG